MRAPHLLHVRGHDQLGWCHLSSARLVGDLVRIEVAEGAGQEVVPADLDAWMNARRGAVALPCGPAMCEDRVLLGERLDRWLVDDDGGWRPLATRGGTESDDWTFRPEPDLTEPPAILALARDPFQRLWALVDESVQLFDPSGMRRLDHMPLPDGGPGVHLAVSDRSVVVATGWVWRRAFGGEWERLVIGENLSQAEQTEDGQLVLHRPVAVAGGPNDRVAVLFRAPGHEQEHLLGVSDEGRPLRVFALEQPAHPLPLLVLPDGDVLVGGVEGSPGAGRTDFWRLRIDETEPDVVEVRRVRGFDGRAVLLGLDGEPLVTTARGPMPLRRPRQATAARGSVETFALDSKRYGCVWHRVSVDICLPAGASVKVEARSSDTLYPEALQLEAPNRDVDPAQESAAARRHYEALPFGSRTQDDRAGWVPLPVLRRRSAWADQALPPLEEDGEALVHFDTHDGLLITPPGRYLWLRVHLDAPKFANPALAGIRVTYPRPSMLDLLPAFWRRDAEAADRAERYLALFEGVYSELDGRVDALPAFFDPRTVPAEALDWLGAFLDVAFDQRLKEPLRRRLLAEMPNLYRRRGTVSALETMVSIVAEAEVRIVESFRMRRRTGVLLGSTPDNAASGGMGSLIGPGLQLGGGGPEGDLADYFALTAHRFQLLIARASEPAVHDLIDTLVEAAKPAHTIHTICWLDSGFKLDRSAYVGLTRISASNLFPPALIPAVLGRSHLPRPHLRFGTRVGASHVGHTTHTS
jgi:phage tail-like protein